jgi:hypothetical protein
MTARAPRSPREGVDLPGGGKDDPRASFEDVRSAELDYLWWHRHSSREDRRKVDENLVGLAFSGGGIRSATTCLGVLQALSKMQILPLVDYLCTVSGGGYIGACLSSLLSLGQKEVERSPGATQPTKPCTYQANDRPGFSTEWPTFPFRAERQDSRGRLGIDLVAHLRTHGNFLIARRGLLKRESLRAVGHLLTGISYNLGMFLATLFTLSAAGMLLTQSLAPDMRGVFVRSADTTAATRPTGPDALPSRPDTAWMDRVTVDSTIARIRTVPCDPAAEGCVRETRTELQPPSLWQRGVRNATLVARAAGASLIWPLLVGALLSMGVSLGIRRFLKPYVTQGDVGATDPKPGESADEAYEVRVLRRIFLIVLLVVLVTAAVMRFRYVGCPAWLDGIGLLAAACRWLTVADPLRGTAQLVMLIVPLAVLIGARILSFLIGALGPSFKTWTRRSRSLWSAYQAITVYGWYLMLGFALFPLAAFALSDYQLSIGFGALGSLFLTRLLASRRAIIGTGKVRLAAPVRRALLALAVVLVLVLGLIFFGSLLVGVTDLGWLGTITLGGVLLFLIFGFVVDHNKLGPHYFYRDRLAETYLLSELPDEEHKLHTYRDAMEMPLSALHGKPAGASTPAWKNPAPYHLISAAINLGGSRDLTRKDRKSGYWLFSKLYCGSTHTGFRPTESYRRDETKLGRAVAISGAAASSAIGTATFFAQAFATVVFNIRLGYWMENPHHAKSLKRQEGFTFWPGHLWRELSMNTTEHGRLVNLSDGGHTGDNVGVYPLLQRRCKIIIACDAERDSTLSFGSFTEALRHAYVDLGVDVDIDLTMLRPDPVTGFSRSHCAVGRVRYPDRPDQESFLIYMKNSLTGDEPEPILNYKSANPAFPHESTVDQFFDDAQFESYRALGVHLAEHTFSRWNTTKGFELVREQQWPR